MPLEKKINTAIFLAVFHFMSKWGIFRQLRYFALFNCFSDQMVSPTGIDPCQVLAIYFNYFKCMGIFPGFVVWSGLPHPAPRDIAVFHRTRIWTMNGNGGPIRQFNIGQKSFVTPDQRCWLKGGGEFHLLLLWNGSRPFYSPAEFSCIFVELELIIW